MQVEVKRITENRLDLIEKLTTIENEAFGVGGLNIWGLVPMINHGVVFVIFVNGAPAGLIEYMRDFDNPEFAYLYGLAISKKYQGQGLGKELLTLSLEKIRKKDITEIVLTVSPENKVALQLYKNFGFKQIDFSKAEYGLEEDRLIMSLKC